MKTRLVVLAISMTVIMALGLFAALKPASAAVTYGPRVDQLLCKIYASSTNEFTAFQAGEVDIIDWPLTKTLVPVINNTAGYSLDKFRQFSLYEFDINNNATVSSYPGIKIPTSDKNFRIAMAYMVDKPYIANVIVGGYAVATDAPIMPWLPWYDPLMTTYAYNPALACQTLYNYGWRADADPNSGAVVHFPATWPTLAGGPVVAGLNLATVFNKADVGFGAGSGPGIIFLRRSDDPLRSGAGNLLINGDATHKGLVSIGIAVDDFNVPRATTSPNVMYAKNYMVYTGGWSLSRNPDYVYDLYNPTNYTPDPNTFAQNYCNVDDPGLNAAETQIKLAPTLAIAQAACKSFCDIWGKIQPMICLWATAGYYANRNIVHVLNADSYSIPSYFDLLCMNLPGVGITGGTVNWGFASDVQMLNVINSQWGWDWQVLGEIYDNLIRYNPLNIGVDMPWMATSWAVGTWNVPSGPNAGGIGTTVTYILNRSINFVNPTTGTVYGAVTPADVAFSIQYTYGTAGWNSPSLVDCFTNATTAAWAANAGYQIPFVKTGINSLGQSWVTVYFRHQSVWAVDWAGGIPILPKAIFNTINDPTGFYPGGDTNVAALTGSGPFYFGSYSLGVSCLLLANRNFFAPIVPNVDNNPTLIHIDWGLFRSNCDNRWTVTQNDVNLVLSCMGLSGPYGGWIPEDVNKDGKVNTLDLVYVATDIGAGWLSDTWGAVAIGTVTCDKDGGFPVPLVCQNRLTDVNVSVISSGPQDYVTVELYANDTLIGSAGITVGSSGITVGFSAGQVGITACVTAVSNTAQNVTWITFGWNDSGFPLAVYFFRAVLAYYGDVQPCQAVNGSSVTVAKPGDINNDGFVNLLDLIIAARALSVYNPSADVINNHHQVNVLDLIFIARHLGL